MTIFSKRYQRALMDGRLVVPTVSARARMRAWMLMLEMNRSWQVVDETNWSSLTTTLDEAERLLRREYGEQQLIAYEGEGNERGPVSFETFAQRCYPRQFLDAVEAFHAELDDDLKGAYEREVNRIFREENQPWRLSTGELFKIDSDFLDVEVLARTEELLSERGFPGALDEFREARNDLTAGNTREAIAKAQAALESTMKTILGVQEGTASSLIRDLVAGGFFNDLPASTPPASFGESILMSVPFLGNRLGRHGQGEAVVDVPHHYAELAIHLAGSVIRLLVRSMGRVLNRRRSRNHP